MLSQLHTSKGKAWSSIKTELTVSFIPVTASSASLGLAYWTNANPLDAPVSLSTTIKTAREKKMLLGNCKRAEGCIVSKLVTWRPTQGARSEGRPKKTYVDQLDDTYRLCNQWSWKQHAGQTSLASHHQCRQQESTEWVSELFHCIDSILDWKFIPSRHHWDVVLAIRIRKRMH